jgi:hypothetical protein
LRVKRAKKAARKFAGAMVTACLAKGDLWQHGKSRMVAGQVPCQPAAREGETGLCGMAERFVVPKKPGNAGGGKGPWFKVNAGRSEGEEIGVSLTNSRKCREASGGIACQSEERSDNDLRPLVCERMKSLVRKPDAGKPPVRFDERGVETGNMAQLLRHRQPKGSVSATAAPKLYRATPRLYYQVFF